MSCFVQFRCLLGRGGHRWDVAKVRQILLNLLSDAGKFTDKGGVELQESGGRDRQCDLSPTTVSGMSPAGGQAIDDFAQANALRGTVVLAGPVWGWPSQRAVMDMLGVIVPM